MQSDLDLNPLNDSHMFHISNQVRRYPNHGQHGPNNFNQSSVTNNEAASYFKFERGGEEMTHSDSSLWLNEELDAAQYENRIR